jgi:hypothetical protein
VGYWPAREFISCAESQAQTPSLESVAPTLPSRTPVKVRLKHAVSSKDAKAGQSVELEIVEDVDIDGEVVIQRGTPVAGTVMAVAHRGKGLKDARLLVDLIAKVPVKRGNRKLAAATSMFGLRLSNRELVADKREYAQSRFTHRGPSPQMQPKTQLLPVPRITPLWPRESQFSP